MFHHSSCNLRVQGRRRRVGRAQAPILRVSRVFLAWRATRDLPGKRLALGKDKSLPVSVKGRSAPPRQNAVQRAGPALVHNEVHIIHIDFRHNADVDFVLYGLDFWRVPTGGRTGGMNGPCTIFRQVRSRSYSSQTLTCVATSRCRQLEATHVALMVLLSGVAASGRRG